MLFLLYRISLFEAIYNKYGVNLHWSLIIVPKIYNVDILQRLIFRYIVEGLNPNIKKLIERNQKNM